MAVRAGLSCKRTSLACARLDSQSVSLCSLRPKDPCHPEKTLRLLTDSNLINHTHTHKSDHLVKNWHKNTWTQTEFSVCPRFCLMAREWLLVSDLADCAETRMWESHGYSECASSILLVASDGSGGSRDTSKSLRQVAFGEATFSGLIL